MRGSLGGVALLLWTAAAAAQPFSFPEGNHGRGELRYRNGIPVLSVAGTPEEIGEQVGALAVAPAQRVLAYPRQLLEQVHLGLLWHPLLKAGERMVAHFPTDYRAELEATIRAARVDRDPVVAGNTFFDLKKILACSAL